MCQSLVLRQQAQMKFRVLCSLNPVNTSKEFLKVEHRTLSDSARLNILLSELACSQPFSTYQPQRLIKQPEDVTVPSYVTCLLVSNGSVITHTRLSARECFHNKQILPHVWSEKKSCVCIIFIKMTKSETHDFISHMGACLTSIRQNYGKSLITTLFLKCISVNLRSSIGLRSEV